MSRCWMPWRPVPPGVPRLVQVVEPPGGVVEVARGSRARGCLRTPGPTASRKRSSSVRSASSIAMTSMSAVLPGPRDRDQLRVADPPDHVERAELDPAPGVAERDPLQGHEEPARALGLPDLAEPPPPRSLDQPIARNRRIARMPVQAHETAASPAVRRLRTTMQHRSGASA